MIRTATQRLAEKRLARHRNTLPIGVEPPKDAVVGLGPLGLIQTALWFGVVAGLLELVAVWTQWRLVGWVTPELLRTSWHFAWMIVAANLGVFAAFGVVLAGCLPFGRRAVVKGAGHGFWFLLFLIPLLAIPGLHVVASLVLAAGLAVRLGRLGLNREDRFRRVIQWSLPVLVVGSSIWGFAQYQRVESAEARMLGAAGAAVENAPNVLLLVLDTVRAESLGFQGYDRDTTPRLAQMADAAIVFEHARTPSPWTLPAHGTLFTGRWPHELSVSGDKALDRTFPTLAEVLSERGYATAGFVANTFYCNAWYGLDRGFAHYRDYDENRAVHPLEALRACVLGRLLIELGSKAGVSGLDAFGPRKDAEQINREALEWIDTQAERPWFAFLNYFDAHAPYHAPGGFAGRFQTESSALEGHDAPLTPKALRHLNRQDLSLEETEQLLHSAARLQDAYDDCLAYLDDQIGALFDTLDAKGLLEQTWVIITSDHGEHFGEHRLFGHGNSLYRSVLHVPLMIVPPKGFGEPAGRRVQTPVSLRDVPATVLDLLGGTQDLPFPGTSLARYWETFDTAAQGPEALIRSELDLGLDEWIEAHPTPALRGPMQSIVAEGLVYIQDGDGTEELYDLVADPGETVNLAPLPAYRAPLERLRQRSQPRNP